jgi:hypothetical protein
MNNGPAFQYDVFISYSSKNADWVQNTLLPALENAGLRACIDVRDFEPGVPSLVNMEQAADRSRHTLVVLTPDWVNSEWTGFESLLVQGQDPIGRRRRLIPLMLERCELPPRIGMLTYIDFTQGNLDLAWERLLRGLGARAGGLAPGVPAPSVPAPAAAAPAGAPGHDLVQLRDRLIDRCDLGDLRTLCFTLGIDHENYPTGKRDFVIGLLNDLRKWDRVDEFLEAVRADAPWVLK